LHDSRTGRARAPSSSTTLVRGLSGAGAGPASTGPVSAARSGEPRSGIRASARGTGGPAVLPMYHGATFVPVTVRPKPAAMAGGNRYGGKVMIIHQYVSKAVQDDARRAGERDRLLLEARRVRMPGRERAVPVARMQRMARL